MAIETLERLLGELREELSETSESIQIIQTYQCFDPKNYTLVQGNCVPNWSKRRKTIAISESYLSSKDEAKIKNTLKHEEAHRINYLAKHVSDEMYSGYTLHDKVWLGVFTGFKGTVPDVYFRCECWEELKVDEFFPGDKYSCDECQRSLTVENIILLNAENLHKNGNDSLIRKVEESIRQRPRGALLSDSGNLYVINEFGRYPYRLKFSKGAISKVEYDKSVKS